MKTLLQPVFIIISFLLITGAANAQRDSLKTNICFEKKGQRSKFTVKAQKLTVQKGSAQDVKFDNEIVNNAMKEIGASLKDCNYSVTVEKHQVFLCDSVSLSNKPVPMVLYGYVLTLADNHEEDIMQAVKSELGEDEYSVHYLSAYEMNISCYYYILKNKINFLTQFGSFTYPGFSPAVLIKAAKEQALKETIE